MIVLGESLMAAFDIQENTSTEKIELQERKIESQAKNRITRKENRITGKK
jgi:hypothetical protein